MVLCHAKNDPGLEWLHLLESYRNIVLPAATVLEIGASSVQRTRQLAEHCRELVGVEVMPDRLPKDFGNVKYVVGDWQRLSEIIPKGSVDVAVSNHVIEHVKDDVAAFNELYKVLKPGGTALINTPNRKRITRALIELFAGARKFPFWEHEREYVEADMVRLLQDMPFASCKIYPVVFGLTGGSIHCYVKTPSSFLRRFCASWEVHLTKD